MTIIIVRHGRTDLNDAYCWQGRIDVPLNEEGVMQAQELGEKLSDIRFDAVYSSPLRRAMETTNIILQRNHYNTPTINIDNRLMEIDCGDWEGKCYSSANNGVPDECYLDFLRRPFSFPQIPNGESVMDVCNRTGEFFDELVSKTEYKEKTVLVSTHGCAMRGIIYQLHKGEDSFWMGGIPDNCAVCIIKKQSNQDKVELILDNKSLDGN